MLSSILPQLKLPKLIVVVPIPTPEYPLIVDMPLTIALTLLIVVTAVPTVAIPIAVFATLTLLTLCT
jgi:hypothetical protein